MDALQFRQAKALIELGFTISQVAYIMINMSAFDSGHTLNWCNEPDRILQIQKILSETTL